MLASGYNDIIFDYSEMIQLLTKKYQLKPAGLGCVIAYTTIFQIGMIERKNCFGAQPCSHILIFLN
jgi:hypothetical protein